MNLRTKRKLTLCTACGFFVLTGIEYAIIFPSLWLYISNRFNSPDYMLGVVVSAFSLTGLFLGPFIGIWADGTDNIRLVLLATNLAEIAGSFLYFVGLSHWLLFVARLLSGLGTGAIAAIMADVARSTEEKDRTSLFALLSGCRQVGLILGPSLSLGLQKLHFQMGPFLLDGYSSPGLLMAFLWALMEGALLWGYFNLAQLVHQQRLEDTLQCSYLEVSLGNQSEMVSPSPATSRRGLLPSFSAVLSLAPDRDDGVGEPTVARAWRSPSSPAIQAHLIGSLNEGVVRKHQHRHSPIQLSLDDSDLMSDAMIESAERFILSSESTDPAVAVRAPFSIVGNASDDTEQSTSCSTAEVSLMPATAVPDTVVLRKYCSEYIREEVVVLLAVTFLVTYSQTLLETALAPLAKEFYGYGELRSSIIYLFCGMEILVVFIGVQVLSRRVSDRKLLLFGLTFMCLGAGLWLCFSLVAKPGQLKSLPLFALAAFVDLLGMPILCVCTTSLISKVTTSEHQAVTQSLRMGLVQLGCTLGPLWTGGSLRRKSMLFGVPYGLCILFTIMFFASFPKLRAQRLMEDEGSLETEEVAVSPKDPLTADGNH